ncbi:MAG: helix-turn-helix domain-containing protein [Usitatibacter sp.]
MDAKDDVRARNLANALALIEGHANGIYVREPILPIDVAAIRRRTGMTQEQFAARFGFSVATLRHWERGNRRPREAALVLLSVIARSPKSVR